MHLSEENSNPNLKFILIDITSALLAVFADAAFATNADLTSQLEFLVALADKFINANVLQYARMKSKRVTRGVLSAELFAAVTSFDHASTFLVTLNSLLMRYPLSPLHRLKVFVRWPCCHECYNEKNISNKPAHASTIT